MINGIAILGLNGGGKSTLAHALSKECGYLEIDVEDCYFPEQSESRKQALENKNDIITNHLGSLPFSIPREKKEVESMILEKVKTEQKFILSGVTMNWSDEILSRIDIAFWIQTPVDVRLKRIQNREEKRFGDRVLAGGDMYLQQIDFKHMVGKRDEIVVEESIRNLKCPVIIMDGTCSIDDNLGKIMDRLGII